MFKYNNTHIFTGYLKQLLSSFNLPACKIYTEEFAQYLEKYGEEDPRVLESFDVVTNEAGQLMHPTVRINYLKNDEVYNYFSDKLNPARANLTWRRSSNSFYSTDHVVHGLTRSLNSSGIYYDTVTHEYLGDYLRFLRDYYNINLMSMYNCFNDKIYNNIYYKHKVNIYNVDFDENSEENQNNKKYLDSYTIFDSQNPNYRIYAIPVKLFSDYTIAIDCDQSIELFCGLYNTVLDLSDKANKLATKTYMKINKTIFSQPFLYDRLNIKYWATADDFVIKNEVPQINTGIFTRWDIANREKDLKLFIKVPASCRSSITILEGDYRGFNDFIYTPAKRLIKDTYTGKARTYDKEITVWAYQQNHSVLNFNTNKVDTNYTKNTGDGIDLNNYKFKPISKLQLLAMNTGESYPFADRLVEYLSGSAITPLEDIPDNVKRTQRVMEQNKSYFKIEGIWEDKMQNILYDYMTSSGPIEVVFVGDDEENDPDNFGKRITKPSVYPYKTKQVTLDRRQGLHPRLGYISKSTLYDILGYVDKDAEKWYASWTNANGVAKVKTSIQNIDIYDGLYDI